MAIHTATGEASRVYSISLNTMTDALFNPRSRSFLLKHLWQSTGYCLKSSNGQSAHVHGQVIYRMRQKSNHLDFLQFSQHWLWIWERNFKHLFNVHIRVYRQQHLIILHYLKIISIAVLLPIRIQKRSSKHTVNNVIQMTTINCQNSAVIFQVSTLSFNRSLQSLLKLLLWLCRSVPEMGCPTSCAAFLPDFDDRFWMTLVIGLKHCYQIGLRNKQEA